VKHIILFLAVVCAVASSLFFYAATVVASKTHWATQVCTAAGEMSQALVLCCGGRRIGVTLVMMALAAAFAE
jgi:hypothetical protein